MNLLQRARLYITRKKGRTLLMFCILFIMATAIISGLSIQKATVKALQQAREAVGSNFSMMINYGEDNPNIKNEEAANEFGTGIRSTNTGDPLSKDLIKKVAQTDGIKNFNAAASAYLENNGLQSIVNTTGNSASDIIYSSDSTEASMPELQFQANIYSELSSIFTSGQMKLTQGRHIKEDDKHKILIHKALADKNNLKLSDKIKLKTASGNTKHQLETEVEIIGIFEDAKKNNDTYMMAFLMPENTIIGDGSTYASLEGKDKDEYETATFYLKDPKEMDQVVENVKQLDIDWKQFSIDTNDAQYKMIAGSIENVDGLITTILYAVFIISCIILTLILSLWIKGRIHETGILLSIGIHKYKIVLQYITELLIIAVLAFGLSLLSGNMISQSLGNALVEKMSAQQEALQQMEGGIAVSVASVGSINSITPEDEIKNLDISVSTKELLYVYFIGALIIIISVCLSSVSILRLKPKEILSKMS